MKHSCHKAAETARTLLLHCDWVACSGCGRDKESTTKADIYRVNVVNIALKGWQATGSGTLDGVYTWERMTDLSPVGNCSRAMEEVAGQGPANVARMERNDPIPEKFVLELKRQDEEGCWESNSSPLLVTYDVQLVEP